MYRRSLFWLLAAGSLAACGPDRPGAVAEPSGSGTPPGAAVAADYRWLAADPDLRRGFSFVWVRSRTTAQVLDLLGAQEMERVPWNQLVSSGDGQRGVADRFFFGVSRINDEWVLIVEDNGALGTTDEMLRRLSAGTTVISNYRAPTGRDRLLVRTGDRVDLDFDPLTGTAQRGARTAELSPTMAAVGFGSSTEPVHSTAAALALTERLTGIAVTEELLRSKTYLLSSAPRPSGTRSS